MACGVVLSKNNLSLANQIFSRLNPSSDGAHSPQKNLLARYKKMATEAYCVKCKAKGEMKDPKEVEMNGKGGKKRAAMTGTCAKCSTKMFKIMGMKK